MTRPRSLRVSGHAPARSWCTPARRMLLAPVLTVLLLPATAGPAAGQSWFRRGDANTDGLVDISDGVRILNFLFLGFETLPCRDAADADDSGALDITDPISILGFLFLGEGALPAPGPVVCGGDPTDDGLDCPLYSGSCGALRVSEPLAFDTAGQGLFGPDQELQRDFLEVANLYHAEKGPTSTGRIVEDVSQDVPLEVLQAAWDQAMATCTGYRYTRTVHSSCAPVVISPTPAECESGFIGRRTVSVNCCVSPTDDYSNGCFDIPFSPDTVTRSYTVDLNIDLGTGIGPRPTKPAPRPFDIGMVATYQAFVDVGLELELIRDPGSVQVHYPTVATLEASSATVPAGSAFTLTARHEPVGSAIRMSSRYPRLGTIFRYFIDARTKLETDYAHMDPSNGQQVRGHEVVFDYDTADDPKADEFGRLTGEMFGVDIGLSGLELRIMNNNPYGPEAFQDVVWRIPAELELVFTNPPSCPLDIPVISNKFCSLPVLDFSRDVFSLKMRTPDLDTPASPEFNGGVQDFAAFEPVIPLRNHVDDEGKVTNTSPSRFRPILNFNPDDLKWQDFFGDNTELSTDSFRFVWDLDGTLSIANPAFTTGANWKKVDVRGEKILSFEANLLDIDLILWLHEDQTLTFEPGLVADLQFDRPVLVRENPQDAWTEASSWTLPVDVNRDHKIEIVQPEGGVRITPTYSARGNRFTNRTRNLLTFGYQESFLSAKIQGIIVEFLLSALLPVDPEFALFRATFAHLPIEGKVRNDTWPLAGFEDVTGKALEIQDPGR